MKSKILIAIVAGVLLAGGIGYAAAWYLKPSHDDAIQLVPNDAAAYASVFLDPSTRQKLAIRDLLSKFPSNVASPDKAQTAVEKLFTNMLDGTGLQYRSDVEPWLGNEIAGWSGPLPSSGMPGSMTSSGASMSTSSLTSSSASSPRGTAALLLSTTDGRASMGAVHKAENRMGGKVGHGTYKGVDFDIVGSNDSVIGVVDNFLVVGTRSGFEKTVDTAKGDNGSLEGSNTFKSATSGLRSDRLALFYVDAHGLISQMPSMLGNFFGLSGQPDSSGASAAVVYARPDGLVLDATGPATSDLDFAKSSALLKSLPGDAWAGIADPGFGARLRRLYSQMTDSLGMNGALISRQFKQQTGLDIQKDVLDWMGSLSIFMEGSSPNDAGVGATISSSDPKTTEHTLDRFGRLAIKNGQTVKQTAGAPTAFEIADPTNPKSHFFFGAGGNGLQIAYGAAAWQDLSQPTSKLADDATFKDAQAGLGNSFQPTLFANFGAGVDFADSAGLSSNSYFTNVIAPLLRPIEYAVFGSSKSNGRVVSRLVIGVS
jgi:hypothetical protein